jgi:uncharacterized membrane protein
MWSRNELSSLAEVSLYTDTATHVLFLRPFYLLLVHLQYSCKSERLAISHYEWRIKTAGRQITFWRVL